MDLSHEASSRVDVFQLLVNSIHRKLHCRSTRALNSVVAEGGVFFFFAIEVAATTINHNHRLPLLNHSFALPVPAGNVGICSKPAVQKLSPFLQRDGDALGQEVVDQPVGRCFRTARRSWWPWLDGAARQSPRLRGR